MNFGFTIRNKILIGFFSLVLAFAGYGAYSIYTLNQNTKNIQLAKENIDPSLDAIKDFKLLLSNSLQGTYIWVFSPPPTSNVLKDENRQALQDIHNIYYAQLQARLEPLVRSWADTLQKTRMDSISRDFEQILKSQKEIMNTLKQFEDYDNSDKKFAAESIIETNIAKQSTALNRKLVDIETKKRIEKEASQKKLLDTFERLQLQTALLIVFLVVVGVVIALIIAGNIVKPIAYINSVISQLGKGELPEDKKTRFRKDEIGQIAGSVDKLIAGLRSTSFFAENIGKGQYQADYQPLSTSDVLGNALMNMRDNLSKVAEEDRRRNWATNGLALFAETLRKNNNEIAQLSDIVLSKLVEYVEANQGGLFIVVEENDDDERNKPEPYMQLEACYAWNKKKYLEQKVYLGDGLTGQAWQERATIYLTEVPNDYVMITSGLGQANPSCILIVPLKVNEQVFGVVELASFTAFEPFEIEFVEKIAESIGSAIATAKNNERTQKLLEESKMLAEQMSSQDEETRQTMEQMQEAQEEKERQQAIAMQKEGVFDANTAILYADNKFFISSGNNTSYEFLRYSQEEMRGLSVSRIFYSEAKFEEMRINLSRGGYWNSIVTVRNKMGDEILVKLSAGTVQGDENTRYMIVLDDINEVKLLHE